MSGTEVKTIPQKIRVFRATYANLPTTGVKEEDLGYATDRKVFYRWSGSAWEALTIYSDSGLAANIPSAASLPDGSLYYETDTSLLKQVQSGVWVAITESVTPFPDATAGDTLEAFGSADTTRLGTGDTYVKVKEIKLGRAGTFRIKFALRSISGGDTAYGLVYKNGAAVGTEQTVIGTIPVTKSEDISGWSAGDLCQLYLKHQFAQPNAEGKEFRIYTAAPITNTVITD